MLSRERVAEILYPGRTMSRWWWHRLTHKGVGGKGKPRVKLGYLDLPGRQACTIDQLYAFVAALQGPEAARRIRHACAEAAPRHEKSGRRVRRDAGEGTALGTGKTTRRPDAAGNGHGRCGRNGAKVRPRPATPA